MYYIVFSFIILALPIMLISQQNTHYDPNTCSFSFALCSDSYYIHWKSSINGKTSKWYVFTPLKLIFESQDFSAGEKQLIAGMYEKSSKEDLEKFKDQFTIADQDVTAAINNTSDAINDASKKFF